MKILLVHGIFDTGNIFTTLALQLRADGHECYAPDLTPSDARSGIIDLAEKLRNFVDQQIGKDHPIAIVGFSMGCLVSRYYLQHLGGHTNTQAFFAVSGPLHGTLTAYGYVGKGARDMRPNSAFLNKLDSGQEKLTGIHLYTYRTPFDLMIIPSKSSDWNIAKNIQTNALLHSYMVKDRVVCSDIATRLRQIKIG